jgi:hypothetical protein
MSTKARRIALQSSDLGVNILPAVLLVITGRTGFQLSHGKVGRLELLLALNQELDETNSKNGSNQQTKTRRETVAWKTFTSACCQRD